MLAPLLFVIGFSRRIEPQNVLTVQKRIFRVASVTGAGHSTVAIWPFERGSDHVVTQSEKLLLQTQSSDEDLGILQNRWVLVPIGRRKLCQWPTGTLLSKNGKQAMLLFPSDLFLSGLPDRRCRPLCGRGFSPQLIITRDALNTYRKANLLVNSKCHKIRLPPILLFYVSCWPQRKWQGNKKTLNSQPSFVIRIWRVFKLNQHYSLTGPGGS